MSISILVLLRVGALCLLVVATANVDASDDAVHVTIGDEPKPTVELRL